MKHSVFLTIYVEPRVILTPPSRSRVKDSIKIYLDGDDTIKRHRSNIFSSMRTKEYDVSKVIDRIDAGEGRIPFLAR